MKKIASPQTEHEARAFLEQTDAALATASAEAVRELESVIVSVEAHETALARFRQTGQGLLPAVTARTFLENLDRLLFPGHVATNATTADAQRKNFFSFQRNRLVNDAREGYVLSHGAELSTALEVLIATRTKNRDAWRQKVADSIQALERRQLLNEPLTVEESRRLEALDRQLAGADETFGQANNALLKFRNKPTSEFFEDARRLANQIDYEAMP